SSRASVDALARRFAVDPSALEAWLDYLGIGWGDTQRLDHFATHLLRVGNYDFVNGWGSSETPLLVANASNQAVRIPGAMRPHGVAVHPSPTLCAAVGWRSPVAGLFRIRAKVTHAHPECGNGITW